MPRGLAESFEVAAILGKPVGDFQTERDRLGMNSVRASDLRRVLKLARAAFQDFTEADQPMLDQARSFAKLQGLRGVHHVVRGHPVMQPARGVRIADRFSDGHRECDHIVLDSGFDLCDALRHTGIDARFLAYRCRRRRGHHAALGQRLGCRDFHLQPALILSFLVPDTAHLFAGIS